MWVGRRLDNSIYGTWTVRQPNDANHPGVEELPDNYPDVVAFVNRPRTVAVDKLAQLEARIVELEKAR